MKYVIINGSPRIGNTCKVIKQVKTNLDGEFEEINLVECDIPACIGCYNCFNYGEDRCSNSKKIRPIIEKIRESDAIIIGSPVYAMNVPGLLKNFIDNTAYLYHRPEFFTKKAMVIVTTAGAGQKKVAKYIDETLRHWGVNKIYTLSMACGGKDSLEVDKIDKISKKFERDVKSDKLHSPKFGDIIFFNAWKAMALSSQPIKADKEYWSKKGLVDEDFSPDVKLNMIKKAFSKVMFFILKRFIK